MAVGYKSVLAIAVAAGLLAGCGVRGSLEAPPEAKAEAPAPSSKDGKTPNKPFILDRLIR